MKYITIFIGAWAATVITVLTIFMLCKVEGNMFKGTPPESTQSIDYNRCLYDANGTAGAQCAYILKSGIK